jgi:hypothetical protein
VGRWGYRTLQHVDKKERRCDLSSWREVSWIKRKSSHERERGGSGKLVCSKRWDSACFCSKEVLKHGFCERGFKISLRKRTGWEGAVLLWEKLTESVLGWNPVFITMMETLTVSIFTHWNHSNYPLQSQVGNRSLSFIWTIASQRPAHHSTSQNIELELSSQVH